MFCNSVEQIHEEYCESKLCYSRTTTKPEENDVKDADYDDDHSPLTPHAPIRHPVLRLSRDIETIVGIGKKKYPQKRYRVCVTHNK
jgi:hypothetical protein